MLLPALFPEHQQHPFSSGGFSYHPRGHSNISVLDHSYPQKTVLFFSFAIISSLVTHILSPQLDCVCNLILPVTKAGSEAKGRPHPMTIKLLLLPYRLLGVSSTAAEIKQKQKHMKKKKAGGEKTKAQIQEMFRCGCKG